MGESINEAELLQLSLFEDIEYEEEVRIVSKEEFQSLANNVKEVKKSSQDSIQLDIFEIIDE
jgi:hypothetical protein